MKLESLRLSLSAAGCANLDVVDLPEKCSVLADVPLKIEARHLVGHAFRPLRAPLDGLLRAEKR